MVESKATFPSYYWKICTTIVSEPTTPARAGSRESPIAENKDRAELADIDRRDFQAILAKLGSLTLETWSFYLFSWCVKFNLNSLSESERGLATADG